MLSTVCLLNHYYSSNKNIKNKDYKRSNIDEILKEKLDNLPILSNDTNDVIEFNNSFMSLITLSILPWWSQILPLTLMTSIEFCNIDW